MFSDAWVTRISKFIGAGIYTAASFPMTALDHELESSSRLTFWKGKRIHTCEYLSIYIRNCIKYLSDADCESTYIWAFHEYLKIFVFIWEGISDCQTPLINYRLIKGNYQKEQWRIRNAHTSPERKRLKRWLALIKITYSHLPFIL